MTFGGRSSNAARQNVAKPGGEPRRRVCASIASNVRFSIDLLMLFHYYPATMHTPLLQYARFSMQHRLAKMFSWLFSAMASLVAVAGCSSGVYRAANLPLQYVAPTQQNVETANLGKLANTTISSEIIQPGDVLEVTMVTDYAKLTTSTTPVRVARDGTIIAPLIGKVQVTGYDVEQAEQVLANESIAPASSEPPILR